ncbi:MAG TPA: hypothetical protein VN025_12080 [Candidatus Dormibacteraeota bacterium]|nr:hypothetical protein [Candidatus Dormibacteraeota bacterium]
MPRAHNHEYLCIFHADRERRLLDQQVLDAELAADLLGPAGELRSTTDVNAFITRLTKHAVAGRIPPKLFHSLIYSASLLLQTLPGVSNDVRIALGFDHWQAELRRIYSVRSKPTT